MRRLIAGLIMMFVVLCVATMDSRADYVVVKWRTEDGGNGHFYEPVWMGNGNYITWDDARTAAGNRGGYLATITSQVENDVVFDVATTIPWRDYNWGPWLGGFQYDKLAEPDGHWAWVTGESWNYTNWISREPNNSVSIEGEEDCLHFLWRDKQWNDLWNDKPNYRIESYIVEYDSYSGPFVPYVPSGDGGGGNVVVPAPSSLACLVGVGVLVGLNELRKKRRLERRAKAAA